MKFSKRLRLFLFLLNLCFFVFTRGITGQPRIPKEPTLPNTPMEDKKDDRNVRGDTTKKEYSVLTLTLCDGRTVRGESPNKQEVIQFEHTKDGILYKKKLNLSEIDSLKIDNWEFKQKREDKKGISYELVPKKIRIRTKTGETFYKETGLADLQLLSFEIKNSNGVANLFSYWVDLKYPNGSWYSGLATVKNESNGREDCLKDVVRMIEWE